MTSIYRSPDSERKIMALNDAVLVHWPVPCDKLSIPTRHGNTFVIASGDIKSPPLVLLHGSSSNAVSWIGDVAEYGRRFRVYAVDIPGEAGKSSPNRPSWRDHGYAEWMEDVLDGLGIEKTSILGISLGGWIALKFATHKPEGVEKLVLLAPGGVVRAKAAFLLRSKMIAILGPRGSAVLGRMVFGNNPVNEGAARFLRVIMDNFKPRTDKQPIFTDKELDRLTMPVLLVVGANDAVLPSQRIVARMKKHVRRLDARILPEAGHALIGLAPVTMPFLTAG